MFWIAFAAAEPVVAVVIVDQAARDQGFVLQVDDWLVEDALPVNVAEGESLKLIDPDGRAESMDVRAGEAWEVVGNHGDIWAAMLGDEIRTDLLAVRGDAKSIASLAAELDATVLVDGGTIYLSGEDIVQTAGWIQDVRELTIEEVSFVEVRAASETAPTASRPPLSARAPVTKLDVIVASEPELAKPIPDAAADQVRVGAKPRPQRAVRAQPPSQGVLSDDVPSDEVLDLFQRYAGMHLCGQHVVTLTGAGMWSFDGEVGSWHPGAPGVLRLSDPQGERRWKIAFDGPRCQAIWGDAETE